MSDGKVKQNKRARDRGNTNSPRKKKFQEVTVLTPRTLRSAKNSPPKLLLHSALSSSLSSSSSSCSSSNSSLPFDTLSEPTDKVLPSLLENAQRQKIFELRYSWGTPCNSCNKLWSSDVFFFHGDCPHAFCGECLVKKQFGYYIYDYKIQIPSDKPLYTCIQPHVDWICCSKPIYSDLTIRLNIMAYSWKRDELLEWFNHKVTPDIIWQELQGLSTSRLVLCGDCLDRIDKTREHNCVKLTCLLCKESCKINHWETEKHLNRQQVNLALHALGNLSSTDFIVKQLVDVLQSKGVIDKIKDDGLVSIV